VNSNTVAHTLPRPGKTALEHKTTLLLPDDLYKRARKAGIDCGLTLRQLLLEGLEMRLRVLEVVAHE